MVSSNIYGRYLAEPARYPREVAFYRELFSAGTLLAEIAPSQTLRGPTIRIYSLGPVPDAGRPSPSDLPIDRCDFPMAQLGDEILPLRPFRDPAGNSDNRPFGLLG